MRKIFNQLMDTLRDFLKQRDDLLLLVPCEDSDVPLLLKALRDLDRESGSDLFLLFAEDFSDPDAFLDSIAQRLQEEHELTNEAVGPDVPKLPPLPSEFLDQNGPPSARLEAGMRYAHSLIDSRMGQHFVWGMGPGTIADAKSYLALLAQLLPRPEIRPWMRGARIVARVPADFQLPASPLKRVRVKPFTIPPNAQEEELVATAGRPEALSSATACRRRCSWRIWITPTADSVRPSNDSSRRWRFSSGLRFPSWRGWSSADSGPSRADRRTCKKRNTGTSAPLVPAAKDGNPVLMSTIVENLAGIAFEEKRFADAEERYSELVVLKRAMIDEDGVADALEWQGLSQEGQLAYDRAVECWYESALICKAFEMTDRLPRVLGHLKRGYQELEMREELEQFDAEWA